MATIIDPFYDETQKYIRGAMPTIPTKSIIHETSFQNINLAEK